MNTIKLSNKRNTLPKIWLFLGACFFLSSCTDLIEIEVPDSTEKHLVVDGLIFSTDTSLQKNSFITLTTSANYSDNIEKDYFSPIPNAIIDASVFLITTNNDTLPLKNLHTGDYSFSNHLLQKETSYKLRIETNKNEVYESTYQKNHTPVKLDSISHLSDDYLAQNGYLFVSEQSENPEFLVASFTDRKNEDNYYAWVKKSTFISLNQIKLLDDKNITDGSHVPFEYLWFPEIVTEQSDFYLYQITLNENAYRYLYNVQKILEESTPFSTPPFAPISNIHNINNPQEQVLGFFEIATVDAKKFVW